MLKKLLVTLIASAFTLTAFAQAQKADPAAPKGKTGVETQKADPATPAKGDKPAKKTKAKTEGKTDGKAKTEKKAKTDAKAKAKSDTAKADAPKTEAKK